MSNINPKVAVGLFGIHYIQKLNHWMGWVHGVDYRIPYSNNQEKLYNNFNVEYYSSTYHSSIINELIYDFNFSALKLKEVDNTKYDDLKFSFIKRNRVFKETIELILNSNTLYDFVIITRYDCLFKQNFNYLNIDFNKINFLCKSKWGDVTDLADDNFYIIPYNLLNEFYKTIISIDEDASSHEYSKYFNDINYMVDGEYYSHEIKYYQINRIPL